MGAESRSASLGDKIQRLALAQPSSLRALERVVDQLIAQLAPVLFVAVGLGELQVLTGHVWR